MTMTSTTPETITDEQIKALRDEAAEAGDEEQVRICESALRPSYVDGDGDCIECGHPADGSSGVGSCESPAHEGWMVPDQARAECARVIADAETQD